MKILIIIDSKETQRKFQDYLGDKFTLYSTFDSQSGLQAFMDASNFDISFDLVITDISRSDVDGANCIKSIRAFEKANNIPRQYGASILLLTGLETYDVNMENASKDCDSIIIKPYTREILIRKVRELVLGRNPLENYNDLYRIDVAIPS